jgi:hypothetical protein
MKRLAGTLYLILAMLIGMGACCAAQPGTTPLDRSVAFDRQRALMSEDFSKAIGSIKVAVAEYYMNMGKLPASNAQVGIPAPGEYRGRTLQSATVGEGGVIELVFDANSGKAGGRIRLVPDLAHANAMGVQWRCESPDYRFVRRIIPTCDYVSR